LAYRGKPATAIEATSEEAVSVDSDWATVENLMQSAKSVSEDPDLFDCVRVTVENQAQYPEATSEEAISFHCSWATVENR
jgi:hypothetical protein